MARRGEDIYEMIGALRRTTAELRRDTNARLEEADRKIERANKQIAELQAALAVSCSERDAAWTKVDLELAILMRDRYMILRRAGDMRERIDRCERELDELEGLGG